MSMRRLKRWIVAVTVFAMPHTAKSDAVFEDSGTISSGETVTFEVAIDQPGDYVAELGQVDIDLALHVRSTSFQQIGVQSIAEREGPEILAFSIDQPGSVVVELKTPDQHGEFRGSFDLALRDASPEEREILLLLTEAGRLGVASTEAVRLQAIAALQNALALSDGRSTELRATIHFWLGLNFYWIFDLGASEHHLQKAITLKRAAGADREVSVLRAHLAATIMESPDRRLEAETLFEEVISVQRSNAWLFDLAASLNNYGLMRRYEGNLAAAESKYQEALELFDSLGVDYRVAQVLGNIADIRDQQRLWIEARDTYKHALSLLPSEENAWLKALLTTNLARIHTNLGDPVETLSLLEVAGAGFERSDDREELKWVLSELASVYRSVGQFRRAAAAQERVVELARLVDEGGAYSYALRLLGDDYRMLGDWQRAIAIHEKSNKLVVSSRDKQSVALSLVRDHLDAGHIDAAGHHLSAFFELPSDDEALSSLARLEFSRFPAISESMQLEVDRGAQHLLTTNNLNHRAMAYTALGRIANNSETRISHYNAALRELAALRSQVGSPWLLSNIANVEYPILEAILAAEWSAGSTEQESFFELAQKARSSSLLMALAESQVLMGASDVERSTPAAESFPFPEFEQDIRRESRRRRHEQIQELVLPETVSLSEVSEALSRENAPLDGLLYFFSGPTTGIAWYITEDKVITWRLPANTVIRRMANEIRLGMDKVTPSGIRKLTQSLQKAGQTLLPPGISLEGMRIGVMPDTAMAGVPFAALISESSREYLVENVDLVTLVSLPALVGARADVGLDIKAMLFVSGDSNDLPAIATERDEISGVLPDTLVLESRDFGFNQRTRLSPAQSVIHVAAHASAGTADPGQSGIFLSDSVRPTYTVSDLYDLPRQPVELMFLSACETASGEEIVGEGIKGLARAAMFMGAKRVLATQWRISDRIGAEFAASVYRELADGQNTLTAAVSRSQRKFLKGNGVMRHPKYWAGYVGYLMQIAEPEPTK